MAPTASESIWQRKQLDAEALFDELEEPRIWTRKPGISPLGLWFQRHPTVSYAEAAAKLRRTRASVQMIATGKADPGLKIAGRIELWTRAVDPKDYIRMQAWLSWDSPALPSKQPPKPKPKKRRRARA